MAFHKALDLLEPLHILAFEAPKCGMNVCPETTHISVGCQIGPRHLECVWQISGQDTCLIKIRRESPRLPVKQQQSLFITYLR